MFGWNCVESRDKLVFFLLSIFLILFVLGILLLIKGLTFKGILFLIGSMIFLTFTIVYYERRKKRKHKYKKDCDCFDCSDALIPDCDFLDCNFRKGGLDCTPDCDCSPDCSN